MALPTELLLLIITELPIASRASLALTCKRSFEVVSEFDPFSAITLPAEQPIDFQSARMSKTQNYHPVRWQFLHSLERDLRGWALCSECFVLHPKWMFTEYERCIVPWHRKFYKSHGSIFRSCRHGRKERLAEDRNTWLPSGIVDLCPCIKITMGRKLFLEAWLREKARSSGGPAADFWWHECRHTYGDIKVKLRIGLFLYDGTESSKYQKPTPVSSFIFFLSPTVGELGALLDYNLTYPVESQSSSPRLLCPHHNLHTAIKHLLHCRESHTRFGNLCHLCRPMQHCPECGTKVLDLKTTETTSSGIIDCSYRVERRLDRRAWPMHTVFPFARRQIPLQIRSPWPDYPPYRY